MTCPIHADLGSDKEIALRSLWLEVPPICHLACDYCFADSGTPKKKPDGCLTLRNYEFRVLRPFRKAGGKWLGIPGAGEPLHPANRKLTLKLVEIAEAIGLEEVTIFTAGDLIDKPLAKKLFTSPNVRIMVKWNSSDPEVQNRIVGDRNGQYHARRGKAWKVLLDVFKGSRQRLGIVTSILAENHLELPDLLKQARDDWGVIFDCDTLLPQGRGLHCSQTPTPEVVQQCVEKMRRVDAERGINWKPAGAYVGCSCTRYLNHLYVSHSGDVTPCVGTRQIVLGNIKKQKLEEIWRSGARQKIAQRIVMGDCAVCDRMASGDCSSCLGRNLAHTETAVEELENGWFPTVRCQMFIPKLAVALQKANIAIRQAFADSEALEQKISVGLEQLWNPYGFEFAPNAQNGGKPSAERLDWPAGPVDSAYVRQQGLPNLFSETSLLSIIWLKRDGTKCQLRLSHDGFPMKVNSSQDNWKETSVAFTDLVKHDQIEKWILDHLRAAEGDALVFAVHADLVEILAANEDQNEGAPIIQVKAVPREKFNANWSLERRSRTSNSKPRNGNSSGSDSGSQNDDPGCDSQWCLANLQRPWQRVLLEALGARKHVHIQALAFSWVNRFQSHITGIPTNPGQWQSTINPEALSTLLPSLLLPLTALALEIHSKASPPSWILWLFYDPVSNNYFRRLVDCRPKQPGSDYREWEIALNILYLWPEKSETVENMVSGAREEKDKGIKEGVSWFQSSILNLSDVLRDRVLDYELIGRPDHAPNHRYAGERFSVGALLDAPDISQRADALLRCIKSASFTDEEIDILVGAPFANASRQNLEIYRKLAHCFQTMSKVLLTISDMVVVNRLYENELPKKLADEIAEGIPRDETHLSLNRNTLRVRTLNYFVFLRALRNLGANYYYVGQMLTHSLIPGSPSDDGGGKHPDWRMAPCGFIVASEKPVEDDFVADLRLVYNSVMSPFIEQYAKWNSDYDAERVEVIRNFPFLQRLPKHYLRSLRRRSLHPDFKWLSGDKMKELDQSSQPRGDEYEQDLSWIRKLPKADIHVHLGPAIPINVLYDLSALSLYREYQGKSPEAGRELAKRLHDLVDAAITQLRVSDVVLTGERFKEALISCGRAALNKDSISSINTLLQEYAQNGITKDECACMLNVELGFRARGNWNEWEPALKDRIRTIKDFLEYVKTIESTKLESSDTLSVARRIVCKAYLEPHIGIVDGMRSRYGGQEEAVLNDINKVLNGLGFFEQREKWPDEWGDPLSCALSLPRVLQDHRRDLNYYIGSTDLTGGAVMQYYDTLLLAVIETAQHACITDSIRYMELKLSPRGLVGGRGGNETAVISMALLGLASVTDRSVEKLLGSKGLFWLKPNKGESHPYILANLVIAGKRHDNQDGLKATVVHAVDCRDKYLAAVREERPDPSLDNKERRRSQACADNVGAVLDKIFSPSGADIIVPRVVGVDLVGKERGVKHSEMSRGMQEAFEKCILLTIHAGEDEEEKNIWEAIFSLHAQRIGHGLRLGGVSYLAGLIRDRRIPIELCPSSNHFTNGFVAWGKQYVYEAYTKRQMTVTISTDDPWVSHRLQSRADSGLALYPLSEEFLLLPLLFRRNTTRGNGHSEDGKWSIGVVSRENVLQLIFNGFDNSFLAAPDRDAMIALADLEAFLVIRQSELKFLGADVKTLLESPPK